MGSAQCGLSIDCINCVPSIVSSISVEIGIFLRAICSICSANDGHKKHPLLQYSICDSNERTTLLPNENSLDIEKKIN